MISIGTDLVHIPAFADQLAQPGSSFMDVFGAGERRLASRRAGNRNAEHLAGRWAAKEAFIKAWSQAIYGQPPVIPEEDVQWALIEVRADRWGRVALDIAPSLDTQVRESIGDYTTSLSISHDGDYATAVCVLSYAVATENR
ncbi:putative holo-[acyl-carrier-protein] synthase [Corynebacterium efficiens YS-314]|uniref:Holo-[acyl-carrier-protein] synthase n=1 Tax=Corynebacterium efficiens (strain DSM 44549 / YS-314 / AJ 12310 / JCM 11189 / NBRC 100395) TaxID=196164 RepID=ACPS_COREF|nr:holo-ACP synthase [Corynebacterium efficiens]Q8FMW0.1 RecName: Full=Holo-[acyl-carrier-protein] synthase; Short=Holo-ACP synthase; AltName: Full=4'-phosphopantetheinyl transferase AcpS [Corynebacterium efficiens YS-314]EEW49057.1 putative holo-[acyl-carrier-protein] synthase [Corynebacterium efficiens YS-314]BAC19199.1 putative holo-[acyl-carrier-protein] synthase [Corynebacterium efficiens YS-314]